MELKAGVCEVYCSLNVVMEDGEVFKHAVVYDGKFVFDNDGARLRK